MRLSKSTGGVPVSTLLALLFTSVAQADTPMNSLVDARRCLTAAKIEYRLYRHVEHPREKRRLEAAIEITRAEVDVLRRRVRHYHGINRFDTGSPLVVAWENAKLRLLDAELRLKHLKAERNALQRFHGDRCRMLALKVWEARARVLYLEGGEAVLMTPAAQDEADG